MCWCNPSIKTPQCRSIHCRPPIPMPEVKPPSGGSNVQCGHDYKLIETRYSKERNGPGDVTYMRIDRFFCYKCLHQNEIIKKENVQSENSYHIPDWYK